MINDVYGPTLDRIKNPASPAGRHESGIKIEALIVTKDTLEGAEKVNIRRRQLGLPDLKIIEVPLIEAEDKRRISSTRIRLGEINREGFVFAESGLLNRKMGEALRQKLKLPIGTLITGTPAEIKEKVKLIIKSADPAMVVAVGDESTLFLNRLGRTPDIAIVDFYIKRIKVHESLEDLFFPRQFYDSEYKDKILSVINPPGNITNDLTVAIKTATRDFINDGKTRVIMVDGEEDLAGIPAILLAPLGSLVFYGQPNEGTVAVDVTEEKKKEIMNFHLDNEDTDMA